MRARNPTLWKKSRSILAWALASIAGAQLLLLLVVSRWHPELQDPEYGRRLIALRARMAAAHSSRPDILALGSSRIAVGFRPKDWAAWRQIGDDAPVVFNFGLCAATPVLELLCLRRLLDDGIRPRCVLLELWPPILEMNGMAANPTQGLFMLRMGW